MQNPGTMVPTNLRVSTWLKYAKPRGGHSALTLHWEIQVSNYINMDFPSKGLEFSDIYDIHTALKIQLSN
jgi:hypothetical protein